MDRGNAANSVLSPAPWFGKLLLVTLLVMLNLPVIFTGATGMDQYGFFTLAPVAEPPLLLVLSVALSLGAAGAGYITYRLLRRRKDWYFGNRYGAFHRGALLFGVPVAIAFTPPFLLAGYNEKPAILAIAGLVATTLCLTAALNEEETRLDPGMVRLWFITCVSFILVFVVLSISAMLVMYFIEQVPSKGNFFWAWHIDWTSLGYPAEEFDQRHRNGLLAFTLAGCCYMTVALGGSLLGGILGCARKNGPENTGHTATEAVAPRDPVMLEHWREDPATVPQDAPEFVLALNGHETGISRSRYQSLLAEKDRLPPNVALLVDKASGTAFARIEGRWEKIPFRGKRKGPFLLLCVYARHPGKRFTAGELEMLLQADLPGRDGFNVSDFYAQLRKRAPLVPVERDSEGSCIPATVEVCFLDQFPAPQAQSDPAESPSPSLYVAHKGAKSGLNRPI